MKKLYPALPVLALLVFMLFRYGGTFAQEGPAAREEKKEGEKTMDATPELKPVVDKGKILPLTAETVTMPSGLTVAFIPFDSPGLVAYYTAMRVGSRDEIEAGHSGFAHLFEHMMFRGTKNLPGSVYDNAVTAMGADSSAWTWNDQTVFFFIAPTDKIGKVIEMEAERFKNLYYSEADFKTESGAVLGEYNKNYSNPVNKLEEVLFDKAFRKHTYKHTTMGFIQDIKAMPTMYNYSLNFFKRHYVPAKALIFVVGDFDRDEVLEKLEDQYGDWSGEPFVTQTPGEPPQTREIRTHLDWKNPVLPLVLMGYKVPAYGASDRDVAAIYLAGEMLFGKAGPLYRKLVIDEQRAENVEYWDWKMRDPGLFIVEMTLKQPDFDYAVKAVDDELAVLAGGSFEKERLENARSNYKYSILLSLDTARSVAQNLALYATLDGDPLSLDRFLRTVGEVTAEDITRVTSTYLAPSRRTIATLSHETKKEEGKK
jgi:zinc protease